MAQAIINSCSEELGKLNPQVVNALSASGVRYIKYDVHEVDMSGPTLLNDYAEALYDEAQMVIHHHGGNSSLTADLLRQYCRTLVRMRVARVRKAQVPNWVRAKAAFVVPAFLSVFISNVGVVRDANLGIEVLPTWSDEEWMSEVDFTGIERELRALAKFGFEYSDAMPRSLDGSWDLMTMQVIGNEVANHDGKAHMVYALLGALVNNATMQSVLIPRVSYGSTDRFKSLVREFGRFK